MIFFVPTFFVLTFRTNYFTPMRKKFRVGTKKGRVGSPEPNIVFISPYSNMAPNISF